MGEASTERRAALYASFMPRAPRWYVAAIIVGQEATAIEHCDRQGYELYVPMIAETRIEKGKEIEVRSPRFRGYGFLPLDLDFDQWRSVNGTRGVRHLLPQHSERPLPLPVGFIERLRAEPEKIEEVLIEFGADEMVRLVRGPLADQLVTVVRQQRRGGEVEIELGNGARSRVPATAIERA